MAEIPAFEREPYRTELEARVSRVGVEEGRPYAVLDDTLLYPEGGGQPADRGWLDEAAVIDVQRRAGEVRHVLATAVAAGAVHIRLDWARRFDHMQQHTGQHLLTAVAQDRFGLGTTAFHLGETVSDVELAVARLDAAVLESLEEAIAAEIRSARPVTARRVGVAELAGLAVRTRGLPEGHTGDVRLVEIAGIDLNTCGGTHVRSTAEIETLKLVSTESLRGGTRLFFVAGGRARRRLGEHERRNAALRALLGAPDEALVTATQARLDQLKAAEKRAGTAEEELAESLGQALAAQPGTLIERHLEGKAAGFLQRCARVSLDHAPGKLFFLTATTDGQSFFVLAAGEKLPLDVGGVGKEIAALLGGRGGGAGRVFQGKAGSLEARAQALERLTRALAQQRS